MCVWERDSSEEFFVHTAYIIGSIQEKLSLANFLEQDFSVIILASY